jgi:hypothetical protein
MASLTEYVLPVTRSRAASPFDNMSSNNNNNPPSSNPVPVEGKVDDLVPVCQIYLDELRAPPENKLLGDYCPYCRNNVFLHQRQPPAPSSAAVLPLPAAPAASTPSVSPFVRMVSVLPKWTKESVCRPFLEQLTLKLSTFHFCCNGK